MKMKILSPLFAAGLLSIALFCPPAHAVNPPKDAAGHWEGEITLPSSALAIKIDLEHGDGAQWKGAIDIPAQGLHGFKLSDLSVQGAEVNFAMAGIPGDPKFAGKLNAGAATISGDFSQSGQSFPFKLERKAKTPPQGETPAKGVPGKGLIGYWQGTLAASPVVSLRLVLEVTNSPSEPFTGVLRSVDQGNARIPITALTFKEGAVHLEATSINGVFNGKMSGDGSEISGDWTQIGNPIPLVFKRLKKAPSLP